MSDAPRQPPEPIRSPPLPGTPGHAPDVTTRFAMGVLMIAVASLAIWWGGWPFRLLVTAGSAIMLAEWADMHRIPWPWTWLGVALLAALLLGGSEYLFPAGAADALALGDRQAMLAIDADTAFPLLYGIAAALGAAMLLALLSRRATLGWGYFYIGVPALALLVLSWIDVTLVFWVMIVTWATDIGAYAAGKTIGGPKLAPRISPAKTWAGLFGGMLTAGAAGWVTAYLLGLGEVVQISEETGEQGVSALFSAFLYLGAAMGLAAALGDLYESWVKRRCGVKDSGTILPGHGGVLDRCDGLITVSLATMLFLALGLRFG